jgi:exopolyphosphatase / guanosine-5'-triphosphate,3'-diphosphate pyrophosphatase
MRSGPVAVVDIGSNSIKVLIAAGNSDGTITSLHQRTIDARISTGISKAEPVLTEDGMIRATEAVRALLADAALFAPKEIVLVATSAVRVTGHEIRILTGQEEANLIGRALTCDPALREARDFYVFDLGGGSLECLSFRERKVEQAISLQLGCVRVMEKFVADPSSPLSAAAASAAEQYIQGVLRQSGFTFSLPSKALAIGTGGTMTTARAVIAARDQKSFEEVGPVIAVSQLQELFSWLAAVDLAQRKLVPGLPPTRADVMPVALLTFLTLAKEGHFSSFRNSLFNLRYGVAAEMLGQTQ